MESHVKLTSGSYASHRATSCMALIDGFFMIA